MTRSYAGMQIGRRLQVKDGRDIIAASTGFLVVLIDQSSKLMARRYLLPGESRPIIPGFFNLAHARNTGAVWGILQQQNEWLILFSLVVLLLVAIFYRRLVGESSWLSFAMGCMVGGISGNLVDRIRLGWVTDFLDFYVGAYHWPCFNIADAAICAGAAIYFISLLRSPVEGNSQFGEQTR